MPNSFCYMYVRKEAVLSSQIGFKRLRQDGFPLSLRLMREMHEKLLEAAPAAASRSPPTSDHRERPSEKWRAT